MKNICFISVSVIYSLSAILPLCGAEPVSFTIGLISSIFTILSFTYDLFSGGDNHSQLANAINNVQVSEQLSNIQEEIDKMLEYIPNKIITHIEISEIRKKIDMIDFEHKILSETFQKYKNGIRFNSDDRKQLKLGANLGYHQNSPFHTVSILYNSLVGKSSNSRSVLKDLKKNIEESGMAPCSDAEESQSFQQYLLKILGSLVIAQAKVYSIAKMSTFLLNETRGHYPIESEKRIISELNLQYQTTITRLRELMTGASRDVWMCDPKPHISNVTYVEFVNVFQKQLSGFNDYLTLYRHKAPDEAHVDNQPTDGSIYNEITKKIEKHYDYFHHISASNDLCNGFVWDCEPLIKLFDHKRNTQFDVCHSSRNSTRRFDRISAFVPPDGIFTKSFGQKKPCSIGRNHTVVDHDTSVCTCDEGSDHKEFHHVPKMIRSHYTHRFFYKEPVSTDSKNNYVVTGVKIGNYHGIFYPIIQKGKLLQEGVIDKTSQEWIDLDDSIKRRLDFADYELTSLDWEHRTIKLGDIDLPNDRVLTGLRFTNSDGPMRLELSSVAFNFSTGKLDPASTEFHDPYNQDSSRFHYADSDVHSIEDARLPNLRMRSNAVVTDTYLNFTTSHFQSDLGQTTIPFFDTQNVTTSIPTPMGGVGLYYKYRSGTAGFLGIKLKTYDLSQKVEIPSAVLSEVAKKSMTDRISVSNGILGLSVD